MEILSQIVNEQRVNPGLLNAKEYDRFREVIELDSSLVWSPTDSQRIAALMARQALQVPNVVYSNNEISASDVWEITSCLHPDIAVGFRVTQRKNKPTAIGYRP